MNILKERILYCGGFLSLVASRSDSQTLRTAVQLANINVRHRLEPGGDGQLSALLLFLEIGEVFVVYFYNVPRLCRLNIYDIGSFFKYIFTDIL